jgi:PAS domain S-box-containing protein
MVDEPSIPAPIRPRSLLALGLLGVALPASLVILTILASDATLRERIRDSRLHFARTLVSQLELEFRLAVDGVGNTARRGELRAALAAGSQDRARLALQGGYDMPPFYDGLVLLDLQGRVLGAVPADAAATLGSWLTDPPSRGRELHLLARRSHLVVREPVFDEQDRQLGTLLASVSLPKLLEVVRDARFGATGHSSLLHRDGAVLASSAPARAGGSVRAPEVMAVLKAGRDDLIEYHSPSLERDELSAIIQLEGWPLAIMLSQSQAEVYSPVRVMERGLLLALLALLGSAGLIAWFGSRAFLNYERRLQSSRDQLFAYAVATAESLALREAILRSANNAIIVVDTEGRITSVNETTERWLGYTSDEMVGHLTPFDLHPAPQVAAVRSQVARELGKPEHDLRYADFVRRAHAGEPQELDREFLRKDGSTLPVHLSITALRQADGQVDGYLAVATDISERRHAERALRESEARFRTLFESAPIGIYLLDHKGDAQLVNQYSFRLHGRTVEQLRSEGWDKALHAEDRDRVISDFRTAFLAQQRYEAEYRVVHVDGQEFHAHTIADPLHDADGGFVGYIGSIVDISARKRIEQLKSEFIATVSHELRTPLTSIRGSLGLLVGGVAGALPEQAENLVRIAHTNSERLVRLINDMLDIERIEAGKMDFHLEILDLAEVVSQAVLANRGFADHHGVTFAFRDRPRGVSVYADRDRLMQVLANLMSNAAKYAPKGTLVELGLVAGEHHARVTVTDHGRGVPEAFRGRIFGKFAQADASDTREKGGSGLGLSITKAIVEGLGGRIDYQSRPGETTFWFELPRSGGPAQRSAELPRVLIIEDDPDIARLIAMIVKEAGCDSDLAHDAATAKRLLDGGRYAAATIDLLLPDQDGLTLVQELRSHPAHGDLPLIVVSATADARRRQLNAGFMPVLDWLNKPIDRERLVADVRHAVHLRAGIRPRILHVEDDTDLAAVIARLLGPDVEVIHVSDLESARALLGSGRFQLALLDLGLPDGSGLDLLPDLQREQPGCPVVIFSAQSVDRSVAHQVAAVLAKGDLGDARFVSTIRNLIADGSRTDGA